MRECIKVSTQIVMFVVGCFLSLLIGLLSLWLGIFLFGMIPTIFILIYFERVQRPQTVQCYMVFLWFIMASITIPYVLLQGQVFIPEINMQLGIGEYGANMTAYQTLAKYLLNSFLIAGVLSETLKFLFIKAASQHPFVIDPRSLLVQGATSATAFALIENMQLGYGFNGVFGEAYEDLLRKSVVNVVGLMLRALMSVPLHCSTGAYIGLVLGHIKFEKDINERPQCQHALLWPVLFRSAYDFFLDATPLLDVWWLGWVLAIVIFAGWTLHVIESAKLVTDKFKDSDDVHKLIRKGTIKRN